MPRVSAAHTEARRGQILDAALTCFARQGFHAATMQDIIAESGLSAGAIYNYFGSKEEIIEAIAAARHAREQAVVAEAQRQPEAAKAVAAIRDAFFSQLRDPEQRRRRRVSIQLWAEAQRNPRVLRMVRRGLDGPRRLLSGLVLEAQKRREMRRDVDPDAVARLMIAVYHGFVLQVDWDERVAVEPYVALLDVVLGALSAPRGPGRASRRRRRGSR
jgi:AcrR family transcriptional regulator